MIPRLTTYNRLTYTYLLAVMKSVYVTNSVQISDECVATTGILPTIRSEPIMSRAIR